MNLTEPMRQVILRSMRENKMTKQHLAKELGLSKSWATRLLDGTLKSIRDEHVFALQDLLNVKFFAISSHDELSNNAREFAKRIDGDADFAKVVATFADCIDAARGAFTPRYIPTEKMSLLGNQIIAIVETNKEKPGKIARLVLELLA